MRRAMVLIPETVGYYAALRELTGCVLRYPRACQLFHYRLCQYDQVSRTKRPTFLLLQLEDIIYRDIRGPFHSDIADFHGSVAFQEGPL